MRVSVVAGCEELIGKIVRGTALGTMLDAGDRMAALPAVTQYDLDMPFTVLCDVSGERITVRHPWNCEIEVVA